MDLDLPFHCNARLETLAVERQRFVPPFEPCDLERKAYVSRFRGVAAVPLCLHAMLLFGLPLLPEVSRSLAMVVLLTFVLHAAVHMIFVRESNPERVAVALARLHHKLIHRGQRLVRVRQALPVEVELLPPSAGQPGHLRVTPAGPPTVLACEPLPADTSPPPAPPRPLQVVLPLGDPPSLRLELARHSDGRALLELRDTRSGQRLALALGRELPDDLPVIDRHPLELAQADRDALLARLLPLVEALGTPVPPALR